MERRSSKRAVPRKQYTVDAFAGIEALQDTASEGGSNDELDDSDESADDFVAERQATPDEDEDEDAMSVEPEEARQDSASDAGERDLDETMSLADDDQIATEPLGPLGKRGQRRAPYARREPPKSDGTHTRGLGDVTMQQRGGQSRLRCLFGPAEADCKDAQFARTRFPAESTLPRRGKASSKDVFQRSSPLTKATEERDAARLASWLQNDGTKSLADRKQLTSELSPEEAAEYMTGSGDVIFVMGPHDKQECFKIGVGESLPLRDAWQPSNPTPLPPTYKAGFIINLGARVHCVAWAPSKSSQDVVQYLATSVLPRRRSSAAHNAEAPAFSPQPAYKACVQIWEIAVSTRDSIDIEQPPKPVLALCMEWGDVKNMAWCPNRTEEHPGVGILAVICGDGAVRIINVPPPAAGGPTQHARIDRPLFASKPPDTVGSCVTWLGPTRIAVGCANGCIGIWDVPECFSDETDNPRPAIYSPLSTTYILSITSCYPSHPHMLIASSMSGYLTLTDTREPQPTSSAGTVISARTRSGQPLAAWHDYTQMAFSADDGFRLRAYPYRRWYISNHFGRIDSSAMAIATSASHPYVLVGTASGTVVAMNPLEKLVTGYPKGDPWQQVWFTHEWRRPTVDETAAREVEAAAARDGGSADGMSRILEGYKREKVPLKSTEDTSLARDGTNFLTVYEGYSAITALAWNPNTHVAGWAAAGMANGLLRIEDLAT